ncbi:trypsin-like peptidase domain-containing protein [Streptomyces sp. NPDC096205]|uniref:VMAP-C domain-containing protein n=1 Tax=Streptomyces sp. NPDC096205 TaxID=3366081 RepID=UPI0037FD5D2E
MGWFGSAQVVQYHDPSFHVVSVRAPEGGNAVGAGFLLGPETVLTCAHVVNSAHGRALFETRAPGLAELRVELQGAAGVPVTLAARVSHWIPPRARDGGPVRPGDPDWLGDLAVLRVDALPGGLLAAPRPAPMKVGQEVTVWHGGRHPSTLARLTTVGLHGSLSYLDGAPTGMAVGRGYSGGPLWSDADDAVVGMVVGHFMPRTDPLTKAPLPYDPQQMVRRSWAVPWQIIEAELRPLGVLDGGAEEPLDWDDPVHVMIKQALYPVLSTRSETVDYGRRLALACGVAPGSDITPPAAREFADFLLTHPRALAALTEILRRDNPEAADRLLAAGGLSVVPRLLSPKEHAHLRGQLRALDRTVLTRLPEVVRAALPHLAAGTVGDTVDAVLDRLEALPGDGRTSGDERRVPALLRVMEYLGALCPGPERARLRMWADGVAHRLGIPRAALGERRSDALEWARAVRGRTTRVRVLVQVTRAGRGRHRLRLWCDEGAGPRQVSTDSVRTYSAAEAAREVLRVLDSLTPSAEDERPPLVEVLVDRTGLNLPVDEWAARDPDDLVPGVLGVEFPLVVHCPELLRRHGRFIAHWRSRWSRLDSGKTFLVSAAMDRDTIYSRLVNQLDTVRVSVDVPPGQRDGIVQTCLALGIPVVVWDRGRDGGSHSVEHMAQVATPELPDGVRSYRANAKANPPEFPGRPVLAWADADRTVPRLHLTEPQEST